MGEGQVGQHKAVGCQGLEAWETPEAGVQKDWVVQQCPEGSNRD